MLQRAVSFAAAAVAVVAALAGSSRADDYPPPPPPPPGPPPMYAPPPGYAAQPLYPAPLAQTTQSTYVPQSVAMSGPEEIADFDSNRPIPMGYTPIERTRRHLIVGGAVTLGVTYSVSAFIASVGEDARDGGRNDVASLWIPVAGPFLEMGQTDSATARFFLAGMGTAELAGAIMLYYGVTTKEHVLVRNDLVGNLSIGPMAARGASGMALSGRF